MDLNIYDAINKIADAINENKEMLTNLDAAIGDADHGINMSRGFNAVREKLKRSENEDIPTVLKKVGMTLISTVGGASGPLYGTAFLRAAGVVQGNETITKEKVLDMFSAAIKGIKDRGKAVRGEKTMIDALEPALEAFSKGVPGVTLNYGDAAAAAGKDFIVNTLVEMNERILRFKNEKEYYQEMVLYL